MTESEAIKNLKDILSECTESGEAVCYITDVDAPALEMAIKALEKQIPKKPFFVTVHNDTTYHCSNCKNFIGFYDTRIYEYCHNCGQKLYWQTRL